MITVFGASLTQQKTGYASYLSSKLNQPVKVFGYGGMHLKDAGICFIDKVLEVNPSYCFIDWFSTAYKDTNKETIEYIDTIIHKFTINKCKLIFLFFPRTDDSEREEFYLFCKRYLEKKKIFYIDISLEINHNKLNSILRDIVHTTDYGSSLYASKISKIFKMERENILFPKNIRETKYSYINHIVVEKIFDDTLILNGNCQIIGFYLTVGTHSGIVEVDNGKNIQKYNTWDIWCTYPRKHFSLSFFVKDITKIKILNDEFDTSNCKIDFDFTKVRKKLVIHNIYYIGDYLEVININNGKRINKIQIFFNKNIRRIKYYTHLLKKRAFNL